jgi:hypothetical protein
VPYCNVSVEGDKWETLYYFDQLPRIGEEVMLRAGGNSAPTSFVVQIVQHTPEQLPLEQPVTLLVVKEKKADADRET